MKAMLTAFAAIVIVGVGAFFALQSAGFRSDEQQASDSVRLD